MKVLFLGDIVGNAGRLAIEQNLKDQIKKNDIAFVIANGENSANEGGILPQFLPKRAWYFGGAVDLDLFCHVDDEKYFSFFSKS